MPEVVPSQRCSSNAKPTGGDKSQEDQAEEAEGRTGVREPSSELQQVSTDKEPCGLCLSLLHRGRRSIKARGRLGI